MNNNLAVALYPSDDDAVAAFKKIKADNAGFTLLQMAVLKKEDDDIRHLVSYDSGANTSNDTVRNALIGALCGLLAGPVGILVGGGLGFMSGAAKDMIDAAHSENVFSFMLHKLTEGEVALVAITREDDESVLDAKLGAPETTVMRWDLAVIEKQMEEAAELQDKLIEKVSKFVGHD